MPIVAFLSMTIWRRLFDDWKGMNVDYKTDLRCIEGSLAGLKYRDAILHPIVRPIAGAVGEDFIFMDNMLDLIEPES